MEKSVSIFLSLIIMFSVLIGFENTAFAETAKPVSSVQSDITGEDVLEFAKKQLGKPYSSGAKGPNAFDCSGFVYYVYKHFGYDMPSSSWAYWNDPESVGEVVAENSTKKAKTGDIISWSNHVAIYTEKGGCIEALNYSYGVIDSFPVSAHASGNGSHYRVIRVKGVKDAKSMPKKFKLTRHKKDVYGKGSIKNGKAQYIHPVKTKKKKSSKIKTETQFTGDSSYAPHIEMMGLLEMNNQNISDKTNRW